MKRHMIISDQEIEAVHANANFGGMPKREVVDEGVLKAAFGYHCGHTMLCILQEHGLITKRSMVHGRGMTLTKKGREYLRATGAYKAARAALKGQTT